MYVVSVSGHTFLCRVASIYTTVKTKIALHLMHIQKSIKYIFESVVAVFLLVELPMAWIVYVTCFVQIMRMFHILSRTITQTKLYLSDVFVFGIKAKAY